METQKERVRRLSNDIIGFKPRGFYSHVKLRELAREMRTEDAEIAVDVYRQVSRRAMFNTVTAFGAYFAGCMVVEGPGIQYLTGSHELAGWACVSLGAAVIFAGGRTRSEGLTMKRNLDVIVKEAKRQHDELKSSSRK